jgi:hypothetical protein
MIRIFVLTFEYGIYITDVLPSAEMFEYWLTVPSFGKLIPPIDFFNVENLDDFGRKLDILREKTGGEKELIIGSSLAERLKETETQLPKTKKGDNLLSPNSNRLKAQLKYVGKYEPHHRTVEPRQDHISHQFNQNLELAAEQQKKEEKLLSEDAIIRKVLSIYKTDKLFIRNQFISIMRDAVKCNFSWRPRLILACLLRESGCKEDELALLSNSAFIYLFDELFKD